MEVEKRNKKRVIREEVVEGSERVKKLKGEEEEERGGEVPTEEEVEEFFAILRRMKVAVKYFDERGRGGKEWREALEKAEVTVEDGENNAAGEVGGAADDDNMKKKGSGDVGINEGFDLNTVAPETTEIGGA